MVYAERSLSDAFRLIRTELSAVTLRAVGYAASVLFTLGAGALLLVLAPLLNIAYYATLINHVDAHKKPVKQVLRESGVTALLLGTIHFAVSAGLTYALVESVTLLAPPATQFLKIAFWSATTLGVGYFLALPFQFVPAIIARTQCSIPRAFSKNFALYRRHFNEIFVLLFRRFLILSVFCIGVGASGYFAGPVAAAAIAVLTGLVGFAVISTYTIMFYLHAETTLPSPQHN